jgi:hypothetical protein
LIAPVGHDAVVKAVLEVEDNDWLSAEDILPN